MIKGWLVIGCWIGWLTGLWGQQAHIVQVEYRGDKYWKYMSVDTQNNTPYKHNFQHDASGHYLGWDDRFPRDGKWISFFEEDSTRVASIFEVRDSMIDGPDITYRMDGTKIFEFNYCQGEKDGMMWIWDRSGRRITEEQYSMGDPAGVWRTWYDDGRLHSIEYYKNGRNEGPSIRYHPNGRLELESYYKEGELDSCWVAYYENGQVQSRKEYKSGVLIPHNPYAEYYSNGQISKTGNIRDGQYIGHWIFYYPDGQKEAEGDYGVYIYHHEHGDMHWKLREGLWQFWYASGRIKAVGVYGPGVAECYDSDCYYPRGDGWKYYNEKGEEISREMIEAGEDIRDY